MYKIAEYIPEDVRKYALEFEYTHDREFTYSVGMTDLKGVSKVDEEGYCPMGRVAEKLGFVAYLRPTNYALADMLANRYSNNEYYNRVQLAAATFLSDWDHGRIDNLKEALGVAS